MLVNFAKVDEYILDEFMLNKKEEIQEMSRNINELHELYVKQLNGARLHLQKKLKNPTFFFTKTSIDDEIQHAVKYNTWGINNA